MPSPPSPPPSTHPHTHHTPHCHLGGGGCAGKHDRDQAVCYGGALASPSSYKPLRSQASTPAEVCVCMCVCVCSVFVCMCARRVCSAQLLLAEEPPTCTLCVWARARGMGWGGVHACVRASVEGRCATCEGALRRRARGHHHTDVHVCATPHACACVQVCKCALAVRHTDALCHHPLTRDSADELLLQLDPHERGREGGSVVAHSQQSPAAYTVNLDRKQVAVGLCSLCATRQRGGIAGE